MHLLFDLDGTLMDSSPGIGRSINHTLAELGRNAVQDEHLRGYIGAPLSSIFDALLGSTDVALLDRAVTIYRDQFDAVGIHENRLFPGIVEALSAFSTAGHTLQIVTARSAVSARHVLRHFALDLTSQPFTDRSLLSGPVTRPVWFWPR
jgi:phosphoglycolate phosphatase